MRRTLSFPLVVLLLTLAAAPALAQRQLSFGFDGAVDDDGVPSPWRFKRWSPVVGLGDYVARASVVAGPKGKALRLHTEDSGFLVGLKCAHDISSLRRVRWSWRAEVLPKGASFRKRGTNDQALQLLFGFEGGKVVGYIWDTKGPPGASGSGLSWREDVRVIVVRAGTAGLGKWQVESRDLYADFERLFGEPPPKLVGVAVQANSQHTESKGLGAVGTITLSAK